MSPDEQPINNQFTMQQPYMDVNGLATTRRISQESSMVSQRTTIFTKDAHKIQQMSPQMPSYVKKMVHASLACGIIIVIGTVLVAIGLATGAFTSNQGFAMVSSLLIGVAYNAVRIIGLTLCTIVFVSALIVKRKYHNHIKNQLAMIAVSVLMIEFPYIIINILFLVLR